MATWGYTRSGAMWCDTCGGEQSIPCPETHTDDADCPQCDFGYDGITAATIGCPTCNSTDNRTNLANYSGKETSR